MKAFFSIIFMVSFILYAPIVFAGEHEGKEHGGKEHAGEEHGGKKLSDKKLDGKEHGGKEHGGKEHSGAIKKAQPTNQEIKDTMANYVKEKSAANGSFEIFDHAAGKSRRLKLKRIHDRVGKTGDLFYSCADFVDVESGELLDLDIDVENKNGVLAPVDVRIHKVNGKPRYTYDDNDNRIPLQ